MTRTEPCPAGVLPVDKPVGPTSHDIVGLARKQLRTRRIGHTGTLDPFASGLLLLCIGQATRIAEYLSGMDKTYTATVRLGIATETDDLTGAIMASESASHIDRAAVDTALASQRGRILQVPPVYSAKKRDGERAYAAARAGRTLALDPVSVQIHELTVLTFEPPDVMLHIRCSTGTYIRAIARDIGAQLGVGAHLTSLRRTAVGSIRVDDALAVSDLGTEAAVQRHLMSSARTIAALGIMPLRGVTAEEIALLRHGQAIAARAEPAGTVALVHGDELIAIAVTDGGTLRPRKVMA
jgi:tRNA pseudouridine55 synthase